MSLGKYLDNNQVSSWAVTSVKWAVANGVINGTNNGTMLSPVNSASRAEAITMIKKYIDKVQ